MLPFRPHWWIRWTKALGLFELSVCPWCCWFSCTSRAHPRLNKPPESSFPTSPSSSLPNRDHFLSRSSTLSYWKAVWNYLKKLKMELPYDPAIPLLGIYPKKSETLNWKNMCIPMFTAVLFTIAEIWKQPEWPSVDKWIKKLWYIYTMEYYSAVAKKEMLPFVTAWMALESIMLSEISQSRERQIPYDLTYMWNLMNKITN